MFATLGPYHLLSWLGVQSHTEFLHTNATHVNLASVRDAVLNVLYRGNAVLVSTLPLAETDMYTRCMDYLFRGEDAIDTLLRLNNEPQEFRTLAFTFNDLQSQVENEIRIRTLYRDDALLPLPDPADSLDEEVPEDMVELARDLTVATAHFLLVYAILEKRWTQDRQLRNEVMRGPEL